MEEELTELFVFVDDIYQEIEKALIKYQLKSGVQKRIRKPELYPSELIVLVRTCISAYK